MTALETNEMRIKLNWTNIGGVAYHNQDTGVKVTHYPVIHARRGSMGYKLEWTPPGATNPPTNDDGTVNYRPDGY